MASLVGKFVRIDEVTIGKTLLGFARALVEVEIDQKFPTRIMGLNSYNKQKDVKWFLYQHDVFLFGLLETRVKSQSKSRVADNVCSNWEFVTNIDYHHGGRIWLLWKANMVSVDILEMTAQYIHTKVKDKINGRCFYATFVYGFNKIEERVPLWNDLIRIQVQDLVLFWGISIMFYLKSYGAFFTWSYKQPSATRVFSRIDRALVNHCWLNDWGDFSAHFNPEGEFDHCPCLISAGVQRAVKKKYFKFFNMWCRAPEFFQIVQQQWDAQIYGITMFNASYKIMIDVQIQLHGDPYNCNLMDKEKQTRDTYHLLAVSKEEFLRQKSKKKQMHNKVLQKQNGAGVDCNDPEEILDAFVDYYQELLGSSSATIDVLKHIVDFGSKINSSSWVEMCRGPSEEEIKDTVFGISDEKSVGPDGYTSKFFKSCWDIIKHDICAAFSLFLHWIKWLDPWIFQRLLENVAELPAFSYHPLCKKLMLTHLMFADDLLLFSKGDVKSVTIFMEIFIVFSATTGLSISSEKSYIYE
ncbi:uncharacterized protein LOC141641382 [Silene latifolia]|uniref:uncharacterized protein LOC141641382 n=1 Tax=Silene latifolia TaxID=37657 RepID=UPI003D785D4D